MRLQTTEQIPLEDKAAEALAAADPVMARLIEHSGVLGLRPTNDYFFTLVDSIASQQLSSKVAATIVARIKALTPGKSSPEPEDILSMPDETLRGVGLSWSKVSYVKDLARHVASGELDLAHVSQLDDEEIIKELVAVKGIGRWTAEMFLIFSLARPDVLAVDDYGIKAGMMRYYGLPDLPKPAQMREIAEPWRPYRSYALLYLWHGHENAPKVAAMQGI